MHILCIFVNAYCEVVDSYLRWLQMRRSRAPTPSLSSPESQYWLFLHISISKSHFSSSTESYHHTSAQIQTPRAPRERFKPLWHAMVTDSASGSQTTVGLWHAISREMSRLQFHVTLYLRYFVLLFAAKRTWNWRWHFIGDACVNSVDEFP